MKTWKAVSHRAPRALCASLAALLALYCSETGFAQQPPPAAATTRPQYERVVVTSGR